MKGWVPVLALAGAVAACNGEPDDAAPAPAPTVTPSPTASASAMASSNGASSVAEETDDFLFEFAYPAAAGRIVPTRRGSRTLHRLRRMRIGLPRLGHRSGRRAMSGSSR